MRKSVTLLMLAATFAAGACTRKRGDEFAVAKSAPLVVPPNYDLRPPSPGEPRPQELQPESQARLALLGQREAEKRSEGEKLLVQKAGADKADPLIRYVVDDEFGDIAHKDKSFADRVMFWRSDKSNAAKAAADTPDPIDPSVEAERVAKLTGGKEIIIEREGPRKIKLPGL